VTPTQASTVIGVGNTYRRDDGVGIVVVRRLQEQLPAGVRIIEESGDGAALLDAWKGATMVILVDAVHSGAPPGTIHRLDAHAEPIPRRFFHYSTHAFGVPEAVELARVLNQLPPRLGVYGIEGRNFSAGVGLSAEVEQAAKGLVAQVLNEIRGFAEAGA
jgi:hydrogenase maturation protease